MHTSPRNSAGHTLFLLFASLRRSKSALCHLLCEATCSLGTDKQLGNMTSVAECIFAELSQRSNRPFAGSGHIVRNKLPVRWDANNAVGLPKQRKVRLDCYELLCFESPTALFASQQNLFRTMWPDPAKGLLGDRVMHIIHIFLRIMHISRLKYNSWIEKTDSNDNVN